MSSSRSSMSVAVSPLRKVYGSCISTDRSSSSALMYLASRSMGFARPSRIRILDLHHITETHYKWSNHMHVWKHYTSEERDLSLAWCRWKLSSCSAHVLKCSASFSLCSISSSCSRMDFSRSRSRRSCFTWTHRSHSFTSLQFVLSSFTKSTLCAAFRHKSILNSTKIQQHLLWENIWLENLINSYECHESLNHIFILIHHILVKVHELLTL